MKKIMLLCLGVLFSQASVYAQKYWDSSRPDHRFTLGVRMGGNISKFYEEYHFDTRFVTGLQIGMTMDVNIIRSLSATTGLYYIQKNTKLEVRVSDATVVRKLTPAYLEIPLLLSYRISLSDDSQFQFNLGSYFAVGLTNSDREVFETVYKKNDFGASIGVAVVYSHYYVGINYERSLKNISRDADKANQNASKMYNGSIALSIGYNF